VVVEDSLEAAVEAVVEGSHAAVQEVDLEDSHAVVQEVEAAASQEAVLAVVEAASQEEEAVDSEAGGIENVKRRERKQMYFQTWCFSKLGLFSTSVLLSCLYVCFLLVFPKNWPRRSRSREKTSLLWEISHGFVRLSQA
jgi:hypothetical protein